MFVTLLPFFQGCHVNRPVTWETRRESTTKGAYFSGQVHVSHIFSYQIWHTISYNINNLPKSAKSAQFPSYFPWSIGKKHRKTHQVDPMVYSSFPSNLELLHRAGRRCPGVAWNLQWTDVEYMENLWKTHSRKTIGNMIHIWLIDRREPKLAEV